MKKPYKKLFLDANILFDLVNSSNDINNYSLYFFNKILDQQRSLYCSPTTFAITYYLIGKNLKEKKHLNDKVKRFFEPFTFTREDAVIMEKVLRSSFTDLEDGLQYYSAIDAGVDVIITKNHFDFVRSAIPVYHPLQYISEFFL